MVKGSSEQKKAFNLDVNAARRILYGCMRLRSNAVCPREQRFGINKSEKEI